MNGSPRTKPTFAGWLAGSGLGFLLVITSLFANPLTGMAMDFRLADRTIYATGAIEKGDADKLAQFVRDNKPTSGSFDENYYAVRLNSPGGLLLEGMKIGSVIRDTALGTFISRGEECVSLRTRLPWWHKSVRNRHRNWASDGVWCRVGLSWLPSRHRLVPHGK
jgi:hypothetical protein